MSLRLKTIKRNTLSLYSGDLKSKYDSLMNDIISKFDKGSYDLISVYVIDKVASFSSNKNIDGLSNINLLLDNVDLSYVSNELKLGKKLNQVLDNYLVDGCFNSKVSSSKEMIDVGAIDYLQHIFFSLNPLREVLVNESLNESDKSKKDHLDCMINSIDYLAKTIDNIALFKDLSPYFVTLGNEVDVVVKNFIVEKSNELVNNSLNTYFEKSVADLVKQERALKEEKIELFKRDPRIDFVSYKSSVALRRDASELINNFSATQKSFFESFIKENSLDVTLKEYNTKRVVDAFILKNKLNVSFSEEVNSKVSELISQGFIDKLDSKLLALSVVNNVFSRIKLPVINGDKNPDFIVSKLVDLISDDIYKILKLKGAYESFNYRSGRILSCIDNEQMKHLTYGVYLKSKSLGDVILELNKLSFVLYDKLKRPYNNELRRLNQGRYDNDIKKKEDVIKFVSDTKEVISKHEILIADLNSKMRVLPRNFLESEGLADFNLAIDRINSYFSSGPNNLVGILNNFIIDIRKQNIKSLVISDSLFKRAFSFGINLDSIMENSSSPINDLSDFWAIHVNENNNISKLINDITNVLSARVIEESRFVKNGVLSRLLDSIKDYSGLTEINKKGVSSLLINCMFYSYENSLFSDIKNDLIKLGRAVSSSRISNISALEELIGMPVYELSDSDINEMVRDEKYSCFINDLRLLNKNSVLSGSDYSLSTVGLVIEDIRDCFEDFSFLLNIKPTALELGISLEAINPVLVRKFISINNKSFNKELDDWLRNYSGNLFSRGGNDLKNSTIKAIQEVKLLVNDFYNKLSNVDERFSSRVSFFPLK